jgi:hypothetical protein
MLAALNDGAGVSVSLDVHVGLAVVGFAAQQAPDSLSDLVTEPEGRREGESNASLRGHRLGCRIQPACAGDDFEHWREAYPSPGRRQ